MIHWTRTLKADIAHTLSVPVNTIQFSLYPAPERVAYAYIDKVSPASILWSKFSGDPARGIVSLDSDEIRNLLD